jgi:hypothetical protein
MADLQAIRMGADCRRCPLADLQCGPVIKIGDDQGMVVVRDCPSKISVRSGRADGDETGRMISEDAPGAIVTHALMCGAPDGWRSIQDWIKDHRSVCRTSAPWLRCQARLAAEIKHAPMIVTMGPVAFRSVAEIYGVRIGRVLSRDDRSTLSPLEAQRGHPFRLPSGQLLMPTLSLDACLAMRRHLIHVVRDDLRRAHRVAQDGAW